MDNEKDGLDITPPETENNEVMEVHHHPDLHHKKKHFKEYILEFLMIFLAVTLGFFAESLRETISEHHRENMYMQGFIKNLQDDTFHIRQIIEANEKEIKGFDTIHHLNKANYLQLPVQDSIFFYSISYLSNIQTFRKNDITITQLRNAGGYSLIKKENVADSIALYEANNSDLNDQEAFLVDAFKAMWTQFQLVFDRTMANKMAHEYRKTQVVPADINVLVSKEKERIDLLYNQYYNMDIVLYAYNNMLKIHRVYLIDLIKFLQSKYDE